MWQRRDNYATSVMFTPLVTAAEPKNHHRFTAVLARRSPVPPIPWTVVEQARGITMADSKKVAYDPKKGGKFEPTTKAKPPPPPQPGRKDK